MPFYPGVLGATVPVQSNASPIALQKGESAFVFGKLATGATQLPVNDGNVVGETVVATNISIAVELQPEDANAVSGITWEFNFSAAPGSFELDIQEADTDADAFYVLPSSAVNANSALYKVTAVITTTAVRVDLPGPLSKYQRVKVVTLTNAVTLTAKATRAA